MFLLSSWSKFLLINSMATFEHFYISILCLALFPKHVHKYALIQIFTFHLSALLTYVMPLLMQKISELEVTTNYPEGKNLFKFNNTDSRPTLFSSVFIVSLEQVPTGWLDD